MLEDVGARRTPWARRAPTGAPQAGQQSPGAGWGAGGASAGQEAAPAPCVR